MLITYSSIILTMRRLFFMFLGIFIISASMSSQEIDKNILDNIPQSQIDELVSMASKDLRLSEELAELDKSEPEPTLDTIDVEDTSDDFRNIIFGLDFISTTPTSIAATTDLPFPSDYKISLNDEIKIILTGTKQNIYSLKVGLDGGISVPELGYFVIAGKTLQQTKDFFDKLVERSYVGVDVNISLTSVSAKKIAIVGAVEKPGNYIVNPFTTISNSLSYSGGVKKYASLRNIEVRKANGELLSFDLYDLLLNGDRSKDFTLDGGDTVVIKPTIKHVLINGEVLRPMVYEYKGYDSFLDLVNFALGFNQNANKESVVGVFQQDGKIINSKLDINNNVGEKEILEIFVSNKTSVKEKDIFVEGEAVSSGFYKNKEKSFSSLIKQLQFSDEIYPFFSLHIKTTENGGTILEEFSLNDPDTYENLDTAANSRVIFFSKEQLINSDDEIFGEGSLISKYIEIKHTNKDYRLPITGKFTPKQIDLLIGSSINTIKNNVTTVFQEEVRSGEYEEEIESTNLISIVFPFVTDSSISVEITGQVFNPGSFTISSTVSLEDLYSMAGGIKDTANRKGIILLRESIKSKQILALENAKNVLLSNYIQKTSTQSQELLNINDLLALAESTEPQGRLGGNFEPGGEEAIKTYLQDGDRIFIPTISNEIIIQGEVLNPSSMTFEEGLTHLDYIEKTGGLTKNALRSGIYVLKANGTSVPVGRSVFSENIEIEPGDTIIVPRNLEKLALLPVISVATQIISDIAFSAASLNAINN